jgi:hypothetical protein
MYGMVNKAVQELIIRQHGEEVWQRIRGLARLEEDIFISNEPYPDELTYRLVGAASEVLNVPAAEVLRTFGRWWILHTAMEGYGHLMKAGGRTLPEFLINLPNFHTRIVLMFPHLRPPEFECTDVTADSLRLHYHSHRRGLAPFVTGQLEGLGEMFRTPVTVNHEQSRDAGAQHDVFLVKWEEPAA